MEKHTAFSSQTKNEISSYLENILVLVWGLLFLSFPFIISPNTSDSFFLPKQITVTFVVLLTLILWGIKMLIDGKARIRRSPLDVPVFLFGIFLLSSSLFAVNRTDSLLATVPILITLLSFFIITNSVRKESSILFLVSALVVSSSIIGLLATLSYFRIYILPFQFTHTQAFTPLGSLLEQAYLLAMILPIPLYFAFPIIRGKINAKTITFSTTLFFIGLGLLVSAIELLTSQKPTLLPFETGFQTAFAAFSQDTTRIAQGFFFGSGFGTFLTDFTRFKQAPFNLNQSLWYLSFNQSSSFILELLATTGLLGLLSFLFIFLKIIKRKSSYFTNPLTIPLVIFVLLAFTLPISYTALVLFLFLLSLYSVAQSYLEPKKYFDFELQLVTLKKGLLSLQPEQASKTDTSERGFTKVVPVTFFLFFLLFAITLGFFSARYVLSDIAFQNSLVAASNNNGSQTYQQQIQAINLFPYRDVYYRVFAQTNLALANALATTKAKELQNDPQQQRTLYGLIQQSINSARNATTISPQSAINWQSLASIYRALIGFGQNAENFSILATQQAVTLDSSNPQEYLALGGIYYQLGQYDNAIREFQTAVNLKTDYANGYYNIGHALEQKGDLKNALNQYETVETLVSKDQNNNKKIADEIDTVKKKIANANEPSNQAVAGVATQATPSVTPTPTIEAPVQKIIQPQLNLNGQTSVLPTQKPQVQIPPPQPTLQPK